MLLARLDGVTRVSVQNRLDGTVRDRVDGGVNTEIEIDIGGQDVDLGDHPPQRRCPGFADGRTRLRPVGRRLRHPRCRLNATSSGRSRRDRCAPSSPVLPRTIGLRRDQTPELRGRAAATGMKVINSHQVAGTSTYPVATELPGLVLILRAAATPAREICLPWD